MNTKGTKFLAVLAVIAMAFVAFAIITDANANDAVSTADHSAKWSYADQGPLDFAATMIEDGYGQFDNVALLNNIGVVYDASTKTYTVTGKLAYQTIAGEADTPFEKLGPKSSSHNWGLAFLVKDNFDTPKAYNIKVGDGVAQDIADDDYSSCLLYIKDKKVAEVVITGGNFPGTYKIDFTGVTLIASADDNPDTGFVGLKRYNPDVKINVDGNYLTGNNKKAGNSVSIVNVDKSSDDLYAEYTIYATLAYNTKLGSAGFDVADDGDYTYVLVYQITDLKNYDNYLGATLPFGKSWNTGTDKTWYGAQASEEGNTQETFAIYFKPTETSATGTAYIYFGPMPMKAAGDAGLAAKIKINFVVDLVSADDTKSSGNTPGAAAEAAIDIRDDMGQDDTKERTVLLEVGTADFSFTADNKTAIGDKETLVISALSAGTVSGTITVGLGSDANKVKLDAVTGIIEITKGSIKVFGNPWTAGTITLYNGDVAKVSGDIGAVTFAYGDTSGTATIVVEDEAALNIGTSLTITSNKITMDIEGTVKGGQIAAGSSKINVKDGAVVDETKLTSTGDITVYSGSDINTIAADSSWAKIVGKDSASGTWTYDTDNTRLTLNNYNGTYNFGSFKAAVTKIALIGDNAVSYAPTATFTLFSAVNKIDADEGSLAINVDVSALTGAQLDTANYVFTKGAVETDFTLNQASLSITVSGSNNDWTDDQKKGMRVKGILVGGADSEFVMYNASLYLDIMSSYKSSSPSNVAALEADGVSINTSAFTIKSAGTGILSLDAISVMTATEISSIDAKTAISANGLTTSIYLAAIGIVGDVRTNLAISNESTVTINGKLTTANLTIDKKSTIMVKDLVLTGGTIKNTANFMVTGSSEIYGTIENGDTNNEGLFFNEGTMYVNDAGHILNKKGSFNNSGTITVLAKTVGAIDDTNKEYTLGGGETAPATGKVKIASIVLSTTAADTSKKADGSATVKATLEFTLTDADVAAGWTVPAESKAFSGTLTPSQTDGKYTLVLRNGSATVTIAYDGTKPVVSVSGPITVKKADTPDQVRDLELNTKDWAQDVTGLIAATDADMNIVGGSFVNNGTVTVYSGTYNADGNAFVRAGASYTGPLAVGTEAMYIAGTLTGDITAGAAVTIKGTLDGNLTADSATITGTVKNGTITVEKGVDASAGKITSGKIVAKENVNVKEMTGDIEISSKTADVNVTFKKLTGDIIFNSTYNTDEPTPPATPTTETVTETMAVDADSQGTTIILKGATNKAGSTPGSPGYFIIKKDSADATLDKTVDLKLTAGKLVVAESTVLMKGYALTIEADTTLEITDKNATLDVTGAALKVSDTAIAHFEEGSAAPVNYGKVVYIMKFPIAAGYTIYSNIAYALSNSDPGSTLTMGKSDTVDSNVTISDGIKVIVPKDIVLTFDGHDLVMSDDAVIVIEETGRVVFQQSKDNSAAKEAGEEITYYSATGTIQFGDNTIEFLGARFTDEADSVIAGVAATSTEPAKISATLFIEDGFATIASGYGVGSVKLTNNHYAVLKGDAADKHELVSATFTVAEGAVFDATSIIDTAGTVKYKDDDKTVDKIRSEATGVLVGGTLNLKADTEINGVWMATGTVTLADKKKVTINAGDIPDSALDNQVVDANVTMTLVDTTDNQNGYALLAVTAGSATLLLNEDIVFQAKEYKLEGTNTKSISVSGDFAVGMISATTFAVLDELFIGDEAALIADTTYVMGADDSIAFGFLTTKEIYMKEEGVTAYEDLIYQVTFEEDDYTVFTYFENVPIDLVSDITLDGNLDDYDVSDLAPLGATKLDLSGKDVNITIAEGKTLTIDIPLIIGTPINSLGDGEGSSIVGKVVIISSEDALYGDAYRYIVAYSDVDLSEAEIVGFDEETAAVYSMLTIEDVLYATIYANEGTYNAGGAVVKYGDGVGLAIADKAIVPVIPGFNFTKWNNLNEDANAAVGETSAYAGAKAQLVTVYVKYVEGITYYMNGAQFDYVEMSYKVEYGSSFTAKVTDYTIWTGTAYVNDEVTFVVTEECEIEAEATPVVLVTALVTVKYCQGVTYYCDGVKFANYDIATPVELGSVFTAEINDTDKYQGIPLINGKNSVLITDDVTLTVSGVEPIPEEPKTDGGLSLTDILLIVLVILIAIMVVIIVLRLNRS